MNKKALYEYIMKNVAKELKHTLNENVYTDDNKEALWQEIINNDIATNNEIQLVTDINGYSIKTLNDIIFSRTGYRTLEQYLSSENNSELDTEMAGIYNKFCDWVSTVIKEKSEEWTNNLEGRKAFNDFVINAPDWFADNFTDWCIKNNYNEDMARGELGDAFDDVIDEKLQEQKELVSNQFNWN